MNRGQAWHFSEFKLAKKQKTSIDFSKYRTDEMVTAIIDIISLPGALKGMIRVAITCMVLLCMGVLLLLNWTGNLNAFWTLLLESYAIPAGAVGGFAFGIAEFIRRSLGNMTKLIDLLIETCVHVAADFSSLATGDKKLPPARDLAHDVYNQVILVALKQAIKIVFGFAATPIYWVYHLTLNQMVRIAINRIVPKGTELELPPDNAKSMADGAAEAIEPATWIQEKFHAISGRVKWMVMFPAYAVVVVFVGLVTAPLWICLWLM